MSLPPLEWTEAAVEAAEVIPQAESIPWEDPRLPVVRALLLTVGQAVGAPRRFYQRLPLQGGLSDPLGFAVLLGAVGLAGPLCWQLLWPGAADGLVLGRLCQKLLPTADFLQLSGVFLLLPLIVAGEQFIFSFFLAAAGRFFRGDFTFEAAFRLSAYAHAAFIFSLVPWLGSWLAGLYHLVLLVLGLKEARQLSFWQAAATPVLAFLLLVMLLVVVLLLAGFMFFWSFWRLLFT